MNSAQQKITVRFVGEDSWNRSVFKGDNGRFYKTTDLHPDEGFPNVPREEQEELFRSLCTTDKFDGEPGWPVKLENFILTDEA